MNCNDLTAANGTVSGRSPKQGKPKPVFCCRRLLSSSLLFKQTGELALANRLPLILLFAESPKDGLIAYEPDIAAFFEKAEVKF